MIVFIGFLLAVFGFATARILHDKYLSTKDFYEFYACVLFAALHFAGVVILLLSFVPFALS